MKCEIWNLPFVNVKFEMWNLKCEIWNLPFEMWNVKCECGEGGEGGEMWNVLDGINRCTLASLG